MRSADHPTSPNPFEAETATAVVPDAEALGELMRAHWPRLVAYAIRLLGDRQPAEDVVQHAFVRLWERRHPIPVGHATRPFLYRVVRNLAANEHRRLANARRWIDEESMSPPPVECPDEVFEGRDLEAAIALAVERLPARRREIFVLSRYHGLTNAQIADVLGVSPQTVANQLVSALRDLRTMLGARLGDGAYPPLQIVRGSERTAG